MIELIDNDLVISFPEVHEKARLRINLQRTLRIPDDGKDYPLPPGFSQFPLRHVDDFAENVAPRWVEHGGVMFPMYQSEAMWICFQSEYPFAVKVAAGKINAMNGEDWSEGLQSRSQNYLVIPEQPWLDGYFVKKGVIRQFVAMPLGAGYTAEEQLTGEAEHGGIQFVVYPKKAEIYEDRFGRPQEVMEDFSDVMMCAEMDAGSEMGLAPGGQMKQEIYADPYGLDEWEVEHKGRCFVHIANSLTWRKMTGENPPPTPITAKEYEREGLPWFDYYDEKATQLKPSGGLDKLKSVSEFAKEKGDVPLPENESVIASKVIELRKGLAKDQVREGIF